MAMSEQERAVQGIKDPKARKQAYYKLQREHAEESGDQQTTDKIYKKLGKKSHSVDSSAVDKGILGAVMTNAAIPEAAAGRAAGSLIPRAAESIGSGVRALGSRVRALAPKVRQAAIKGGTNERVGLTGGTGGAVEASKGMKNVTPKPKVKAKFGPSGERKGVKLTARDLERSGHIKHSPNPKPAPSSAKAPKRDRSHYQKPESAPLGGNPPRSTGRATAQNNREAVRGADNIPVKKGKAAPVDLKKTRAKAKRKKAMG